MKCRLFISKRIKNENHHISNKNFDSSRTWVSPHVNRGVQITIFKKIISSSLQGVREHLHRPWDPHLRRQLEDVHVRLPHEALRLLRGGVVQGAVPAAVVRAASEEVRS